jgi:hypothetical protein
MRIEGDLEDGQTLDLVRGRRLLKIYSRHPKRKGFKANLAYSYSL